MFLKKWSDFDACRNHSRRTLVIYGAGPVGRNLMMICNLVPAYFCDKNAAQIKSVSDRNGRKVPVITLEQLSGLNAAIDLLIGILNPNLDLGDITEEIRRALEQTKQEVVIYRHDLGKDGEDFPLNGLLPRKPMLYGLVREHVLSDANPYGIRSAFMDSDTYTDNDYKELYNYVFAALAYQGKRLAHKNLQSRFVNFADGKRRTTGQPERFDNRCFIFGDSRVQGSHSPDQYTICSQLQAMLNQRLSGAAYRVENEAIQGVSLGVMLSQLKETSLSPGDMVFFVKPHYLWDFRVSKEENLYYSLSMVVQAHQYCQAHNCFFAFVEAPLVQHRQICSPWEEYILFRSWSSPRDFMPTRRFSDLMSMYDLRFQLYCAQENIACFGVDPAFYCAKDAIFLDFIHWGDYGNRIMAKQLFKIIEAQEKLEPGYLKNNSRLVDVKAIERKETTWIIRQMFKGVDEYVEEIRGRNGVEPEKRAGAIVMNCNPFTNGHRYLIEKAAALSEKLYIFVVQEDQSDFLFADRFRLVQENAKDLPGVTVLPSGQFIISSFTFPGYFAKKGALEGAEPDTRMDLLLFALCIAPPLNIKTRFVGEEPYCATTRSYNRQMKEILPEYGVEVVEVPRINVDGEAVSASRVRQLLAQGRFQELEKLVPAQTFQFLMGLKEQG